jgi:hypothetical protein
MTGSVSLAGFIQVPLSEALTDQALMVEIARLRFTGADQWELQGKCGCSVTSAGWLRCWTHRGNRTSYVQLTMPFRT